jgi:hypothetical protein
MKSFVIAALLVLPLSLRAQEEAHEDSAAISAPIKDVKPISETAATSTNWSGYAVTGANGSVTSVKASWIVPAIQGACPATGSQYSSFWVGIDGYNSNTVEQTGTDSDCINGQPSYYAWYEFYPKRSRLSISVAPGDVIAAEVDYVGHNTFQVSLTDLTSGQSMSATAKVAQAARSSAEWIAEAPSGGGILALANFGTASFGEDYTGVVPSGSATVGSATGVIGSFGSAVNSITMVSTGNSSVVKAAPSALSNDGSSFSAQWYSPGP